MKRFHAVLCIAPMLFFSVGAVHSQHSVSLSAGVERIENPLLANVSPGGVTLLRTAPSYIFDTQGERSRSRFSVGAVVERSSNTSLLASRDFPSLGYVWSYGWPTAELELRANLAESSTRNTQFEDLGRVTVDSRERSVAAGARWNQELTARTRLALNVVSTRLSYDSALLEGYRELGISSRLSWEGTERTLYYFEPAYSRLSPSGTGTVSTLTRWRAGMSGELAPNWSMMAFAGRGRTGGSQTSTGTLGGLELAFAGSRLSSSVEWSRDIAASGFSSSYVSTEALGLRLSYQFAEGVTVSASTTRSRSGGSVSGRGSLTGLTLENELGANWSSTIGIEERSSRDITGATGRGLTVRAGLVYAYPGR